MVQIRMLDTGGPLGPERADHDRKISNLARLAVPILLATLKSLEEQIEKFKANDAATGAALIRAAEERNVAERERDEALRRGAELNAALGGAAAAGWFAHSEQARADVCDEINDKAHECADVAKVLSDPKEAERTSAQGAAFSALLTMIGAIIAPTPKQKVLEEVLALAAKVEPLGDLGRSLERVDEILASPTTYDVPREMALIAAATLLDGIVADDAKKGGS